MEPKVRKSFPSTRLTIAGGSRWICSDAGNFELIEHAVGAIF
jgi:hypothetical protein